MPAKAGLEKFVMILILCRSIPPNFAAPNKALYRTLALSLMSTRNLPRHPDMVFDPFESLLK
jgi:hypothetical protein